MNFIMFILSKSLYPTSHASIYNKEGRIYPCVKQSICGIYMDRSADQIDQRFTSNIKYDEYFEAD